MDDQERTRDTIRQLAQLREQAAISKIAPGLHLVVASGAAKQILDDAESFVTLHDASVPPRSWTVFQTTGDQHERRRRSFARAVSPRRAAMVGVQARVVAAGILDAMSGGSPDPFEAELVGGYAEPVTAASIAFLVGIPEPDRERVLGLVRTVMTEVVGDAVADGATAAQIELRAWVLSEVDRRRRAGGAGDGIWALAQPDPATGDVLTDDELVVDVRNLCQAAMGSTRLLIANLLLSLADDERRWRAVRANRGLVPVLIEESLRVDTPNKLVKRTCTHRTDVDGHEIDRGDQVIISLTSANRDEADWTRPDELVLDRPERPAHLAFGWGPHRCPGVAVARAIAAAAVNALLDRVDQLAITGPIRLQPGLDGFRLHGPSRLPARLHPASPPKGASDPDGPSDATG